MTLNKESIITKISQLLIAPFAGLLFCILIILLCSENHFLSLKVLFTGTFSSSYYTGTFLNTAGFLMLSGAGSCIALKSGHINLGGEGQIYAGGFIGCLLLNILKGPHIFVFITALILSALSGMLLCSLSAFLYQNKKASVLLTTFLSSAAVIPLNDGFITVSKLKSNTNMLSLPYIQDYFRFKSFLKPSPLCISFIIAILICLLSYFLIYKTNIGFKMQIWGTSPSFALYAGYSSTKNTYISLLLSGALHSLTGFFAVCGTYYTCHKGFYSGMGWNALCAALIAGSNPFTLIFSSLILGWIYTSCSIVSLTQSFGFDISGIAEGIILFFISLQLIGNHSHLIFNRRKNNE